MPMTTQCNEVGLQSGLAPAFRGAMQIFVKPYTEKHCYSLLSGDFMRSLLLAASLAFALSAGPAYAQLGPAGVPGAPGLAETDPSVKVTPPVQPATVVVDETPRTSATSCVKSKDSGNCKTRKSAKKKVQTTCKGKTGKAYRQCVAERKAKGTDCAKSGDPARCEQFQKARAQCESKLGNEHRQCLRDNLTPRKP